MKLFKIERRIINRLKYFACLSIGLVHFQASSNDALKAELMQRCIASLDIIKTQDIEAFNALMPSEPSADEIAHNKKLLSKKYENWFVKSGEIIEIKEKEFSYGEPSEKMKKQYGAINKARTKLYILSKNFNTSTSCYFIQTPEGWFLSKLP